MTVRMKVYGLAEAEKLLKELGQEPAKRALRGAMRAGANVIKSEALLAVPHGDEPANPEYGRLRDNLKVKLVKSASVPVKYAISIGQAFWGSFQEFGTSKMPARPWLRPAFEASKMAAVNEVSARLAKNIERETQKLAAKHGTLRKR